MRTTSRKIGSGRQTGHGKSGRWWLPGGGRKGNSRPQCLGRRDRTAKCRIRWIVRPKWNKIVHSCRQQSLHGIGFLLQRLARGALLCLVLGLPNTTLRVIRRAKVVVLRQKST